MAKASTDTILRGGKVRIYPTDRQRVILDRWRAATIRLWNLLLSLQQAAYDGENVHAEIGWRQLWADCARLNYELTEQKRAEQDAFEAALSNRQVLLANDGAELQREIERVEALRPNRDSRQRLRHLRWMERRRKRLAAGETPDPPLTPPDIDRILVRGLPEGEKPKLFIWEDDLQKVMARLKRVSRTAWIGDLPSHAAQRVVKELVGALQTMLRQRAQGRDVGFPRFKKSRYAAGSVYLANTQITFDPLRRRIKFPGGVGAVKFDRLNDAARFESTADADLMGARIWRQGEDWYISPQWRMKAPPHLPRTGKDVGVKIAASVLLTTVDGAGRSRQVEAVKLDKLSERRLLLAGRKQSRQIEAHKAREHAYGPGLGRRRTRRLALLAREGRRQVAARVRLKRSRQSYRTAAALAALAALDANKRNEVMHQETRRIVNTYDTITVQDMDVGKLLRREKRASKRVRRHERREKEEGAKKRRRPKSVRKITARAAMGRTREVIKYKAQEAGRTLNLTHPLFPEVQTCSGCGKQHPAMADGKPVMKCDCGTLLERRKNAATNARDHGRLARKATAKIAEAAE